MSSLECWPSPLVSAVEERERPEERDTEEAE